MNRGAGVAKEGLVGDVIFTFMDVETTGLSAETGDRICELALQRCRGGEVLEEFKTLVNPGIPISPGASAVNGISNQMVRGSPPFAKVAKEVQRLLEDSVVVCHNAPFDIGFMRYEFERAGLTLPDVPIIATLAWARKHFRFRSNALGAVAGAIGIEFTRLHRAGDDTDALRQVFGWLVKEFQKRRDVRTLQELLSL